MIRLYIEFYLRQCQKYYEGIINLQEKDYESEINKVQGDLIDENFDFKKKKDVLEN